MGKHSINDIYPPSQMFFKFFSHFPSSRHQSVEKKKKKKIGFTSYLASYKN